MNMKIKKISTDIKDIPILSFFTGGGFLDMGFEKAGFSVVWSNEANPVFAGLYSYGMTKWKQSKNPGTSVVNISCVKKLEAVFAPEIIKLAFPSGEPSLFGIIGGPPCPDFSTGGKNEGGKGINGRLSKTYVHRIVSMMPSFFVFENVPGLYNTRKHRDFLREIETILEKAGYCIDLKILNALEFGVPQNRERLIMIGIQNSIVKSCLGRNIVKNERGWFIWPEPAYKDAKEKYQWPSVVKKISQITLPPTIPLELTVYSLLDNKNDPEKLPNGKDCFKTYSEKFDKIKEGDVNRKSFKRLHRYRFSPTACYGHNEVHLHPWAPRRLSVREAMRIQGIPDTYALPDDATLTAKFTLVSNGVPVPLAYAVANSLKIFLNRREF